MTSIPRLMIAGTASGVGKTSVALGLMKALCDKGLKVQAFKVGPDYLDPLHHSRITGRPSRNLDSWMADEHLEEIFQHGAQDADIAIVEGVMGLFDGLSGENETASSAQVAKRLGIPVVLVADAKAMARSFAAIVHGFGTFDPELSLAGVLANRVSGESHYEYLKTAMGQESPAPLLGYLSPDESISIPDRHLGLVAPTANEFEEIYKGLGRWVSKHLDVESLIQLARSAQELRSVKPSLFVSASKEPTCRLGLARDEAIHFYYQDNLDLLRTYGAEIIEFSPLHDKALPEVDLLYLGGGYPEVHARELGANTSMMKSLRDFSKTRPIFAECGGMMLLCQELKLLDETTVPMAGVFDNAIAMTPRRRALGYVEITTLADGVLGPKGTQARGHEFHYSEIQSPGTSNTAYQLRRPIKKTQKEDGCCQPNIQCGYAHFHFVSNPLLAKNLVKEASKKLKSKERTK